MARVPAAGPEVTIEEQPAKAIRFRYECEGRSAGSIPGANSTAENKTFPTLRMAGYVGPCTIVVSCITKDDRRPHPHKLVGREKCDRGVCTIRHTFTEDNPLVQFKNLGIQCVKKKDAEIALQERQNLRVDPFRTGFDPRSYPSIELNAVRLAFQVFLPDAGGQMRVPLRAVASDVIHDKKAKGDLAIVRASHCSGTVRGGTQMILLCEKVSREEVTVLFYDSAGWRAPATVLLVHKQLALLIETPPYRDGAADDHVQVEYRLQRGLTATDDDQSKPFPFEYIPEPDQFQVKKRKTMVQSIIDYAERHPFPHEQQIKIEPNRSPTHGQVMSPAMYSPVSPYQEQQKPWVGDAMMGGPSNPFAEMQWFQNLPAHAAPAPQYAPSPHMLSPPVNLPHPHSPGLASPGLGHASPGLGHASPGLSHASPGLAPMGHVSPGLAAMGHVSPALGGMGHAAPLGHVSPMQTPLGHMSPVLPQQAYQPQQQQRAEAGLEAGGGAGPPSLSALLAGADSLSQINADLFNISSMNMDQNLSDSLNRLSTSELQF